MHRRINFSNTPFITYNVSGQKDILIYAVLQECVSLYQNYAFKMGCNLEKLPADCGLPGPQMHSECVEFMHASSFVRSSQILCNGM